MVRWRIALERHELQGQIMVRVQYSEYGRHGNEIA